ncbi:MAG: InlB B-repeat-containing protein, partial [Eggerthellaceae bacterium]|nr:InlB B-repeat-containing protein [Eggerthellaceae bacterium]
MFVSVVLVIGLMPGFVAWAEDGSEERSDQVANVEDGEQDNLLDVLMVDEAESSGGFGTENTPGIGGGDDNIEDFDVVTKLKQDSTGTANLTVQNLSGDIVVSSENRSEEGNRGKLVNEGLATSSASTLYTLSLTVSGTVAGYKYNPSLPAGGLRLGDSVSITSNSSRTVEFRLYQNEGWDGGYTVLFTNTVNSGQTYEWTNDTGTLKDEGVVNSPSMFMQAFVLAPSYSVTLDPNNGQESKVFSVDSGAQIALTTSFGTTPTNNGYVFTGWNTVSNPSDEEPGSHYDANASFSPTDDVTLYAEWAALDTVAPTALNPTYNGTSQALVTAGSASVGGVSYTMKYSLAEGGAYSTVIPSETNAGDYEVWYEVVDTDGTTVLAGPTKVDASISKAPLRVTADAASITYGDAAPSYTATYSGFVNGESGSVLSGTLSYACAYSQGGNAGTYPITPSGLTSSNYEITFTPGTLTVGKRGVTLRAGNASGAYGAAPDTSSFSYSITSGSLVSGDEITVSYTCAATSSSPAGSAFPIVPSATSVTRGGSSVAGNYNFTYANGTYTVGKANAVVTAAPTPINSTYDGAEHTLATAGSTTGGTMVYSLTQDGTYTTTIPKGTNAGDYTVWYKVNGGTNYEDTTPASITANIAQREAALEWTGDSFTYNGSDQVPTAAVG